MKRREFLSTSVAIPTAALAGTPAIAEARREKAQVKTYTQVGRTEMRVSDISCGGGRLPSASLVLRAIDQGINYFDTAPDYGRSEEYIGEALARFKPRDKVYIASKFCNHVPYKAGISHLQEPSDKQAYKTAVEGSLRRLQTDYLDVAFVHAIGELNDYEREHARLFDPDMLEAAAELKQAGKIRYLAVSSHGPHNMERLLTEAVQSGHFDLIMPAFNFMKFPKVPDLLKEAQARGVGVIAMKTLAGARETDIERPADTPFEHAAFKWVLAHNEVAGLVVTMKSARDIDFYLQASGEALTAADMEVLDRYAALHGRDYCRTGCGDCETACPQGVPIASILRYQMYFDNYGDEKQAMRSYSGLPRNVTACADCTDQVCNSACPYGLPVAFKLQAAHEALSFA